MSKNSNRGNLMIKIKRTVWVVKVGIYSSGFINEHHKSESKPWKIKVVLN